MQLLNQLLRGVIIGVANIIPGVSGGTMMVSMGIYDTLIYCITHLFSQFKKSVKTLLPYLIGMLIGIVVLAGLLKWLFANYPLPTNTAFIGLILGGLSPLLRKIDKKKVSMLPILLFLVFFALIIVMALYSPSTGVAATSANLGQMALLLVVGAIASATMIIPGVSGSMVMMLLGYYQTIIGAVSDFASALKSFNFGAMVGPLSILVPFGIGVLLGIYFVAKLIEWLLQRFPTHTYCAVLGLVVASPIAILLRPDAGVAGASIAMVLISIATFAVGFTAAALLAKGAKENVDASPKIEE